MWMCGTTNPADTINGSTWYGTGRNNLDQVQLAGYYGIRLRTAGVIMDLAGDYAQINGSYRAPIFYDSDNTGYYFNGSGTTYGEVFGAGTRFYTGYDSGVTNSMSCSNWFRSNGSSGWFNASYGGGINMEDSTWVRVYNAKNLYCAADIAAAGNVTAYYSDERLKTKTGGIDNALEKVAGLSGFLYVENDLARSLGYTNEKQQVGVSAQAVQAVLPEAVSLAPVDFETLEDGTIISKSGENYLTVDYSRLVPLLIEAIKELTNKVKALEAKEQ
jgi:chaperonin cofactor prefoldin